MAQRIVITAPPREEIPIEFVGVNYLVKPPKAKVAIALAERVQSAGENPKALIEELENWIVLTFGKKQAPKVIARLSDDADDADIPQVIELMTKLAEVASANPSS